MENSTSEQQQCLKCKRLFKPSNLEEKNCLECKKKAKKNRGLIIGSLLGLLLIIAAGSFYLYNQKISPDATFEGVVDNDSIEIDNVNLESDKAAAAKEIVNLGKAVENLSTYKRLSEDKNGIPSKIQILFEKDEIEISESYDLYLTHFANQFMELGDNYSILLEGYTCDLGTDEHNLLLSNNRIQVIKDYLESKNISKELLGTKSYGKSQFVSSSNLEKSRIENRRVYITINKVN